MAASKKPGDGGETEIARECNHGAIVQAVLYVSAV